MIIRVYNVRLARLLFNIHSQTMVALICQIMQMNEVSAIKGVVDDSMIDYDITRFNGAARLGPTQRGRERGAEHRRLPRDRVAGPVSALTRFK